MKIFKFGGASIKDGNSVKNMCKIISGFENETLVIVVSAMGKTTNNLESVYEAACHHASTENLINGIKNYHFDICKELFHESHDVFSEIEDWINSLTSTIEHYKDENKPKLYDAIVSIGELISSTIVSEYLNDQNVPAVWLDARKLIKTDTQYKEGQVDWDKTEANIIQIFSANKFAHISITQGFIGSDFDENTTTLGREGSDFTAAIFGASLEAESVTIWKDVPGILNADPKRFEKTKLYPNLSYQEAAEMTYYGASVIHPKTIKPLANKNIPLLVKSFIEPEKNGTLIDKGHQHSVYPTYVVKENQCLVSFQVRDLSFINEKNLSVIFHVLNLLHIKINMMQNSAVSLTICFDHNQEKVNELLGMLQNDFNIRYNEGLHLFTIKNYDDSAISEVSENKSILIEQRTRNTYQIVVK